MPETVRLLYKAICDETVRLNLAPEQQHYAVGRLLFDLFERADYEETRLGLPLSADAFDRLAADFTPGRIARGVREAGVQFGQAAASFMDQEIQNQIDEAINQSVVTEVRSIKREIEALLKSPRTFWWNVAAGIVAAVFFALILIVAAVIWQHDPSMIATAKRTLPAVSTEQQHDQPSPSPTKP